MVPQVNALTQQIHGPKTSLRVTRDETRKLTVIIRIPGAAVLNLLGKTQLSRDQRSCPSKKTIGSSSSAGCQSTPMP